MPEEEKTKKLTANSVLKEFNLTPAELKELLTQIYDELEKDEKQETEKQE